MQGVSEAVTQLLEGSVDASVILDRDRRIHYFNRAYEALSTLRGRRLRKMVEDGARCFDVLPLEICKDACVGCRALEMAKPLRVDEIRATKTEEETTFIVAAVPLGNGFFIETYRDVTADVRIQRRLKVLLERERKANVILEETVVERTRELKQAQAHLVLQEKMSALGRLVAGIAHELNNPINFVYGNVDFLNQYVDDLLRLVKVADESDLPEHVRSRFDACKEEIEYSFLVEDCVKLIASIRAGAERTASIVRDLKTFSRAGSGDRQETDIVAGIETTLNLIAPLLKNRIRIDREYADDIPRVVCNASHVNQVFMNILTNAAQAIEGEGVIRISASGEDQRVRITISDSGPGIDADIVEKIADPFFTTKDVGEGTGLGLWITQSIVRNHGGKLQCTSEPGEGATFTVVLPVQPLDESTGEAFR